jgi:hypothetical protein
MAGMDVYRLYDNGNDSVTERRRKRVQHWCEAFAVPYYSKKDVTTVDSNIFTSDDSVDKDC